MRVRSECSNCLRSETTEQDIDLETAARRASVMCENLFDDCETPDECEFAVAIEYESIRRNATNLVYDVPAPAPNRGK